LGQFQHLADLQQGGIADGVELDQRLQVHPVALRQLLQGVAGGHGHRARLSQRGGAGEAQASAEERTGLQPQARHGDGD
jgi:hypothetical protein